MNKAYEDKRLVSFCVAEKDLQNSLKEFQQTGGDMPWRSNPIQVFAGNGCFVVIVQVEGYYPYMDNRLDEIGEKYQANTSRRPAKAN